MPRRKPDPGPPGAGSRCTDIHANTAGLHASAAINILAKSTSSRQALQVVVLAGGIAY
jgi:hypothetical protein